MANQLAYLVRRDNGRYYARFQRPNGKWTNESLGATRAAEAKILFEQWKQRLLRAREQEVHNIVPVTLQQLAEEHLRNVDRHQAKSWFIKQRNYLANYIIPFLGAKALTVDVTPRRIRDYIDWRKDAASIRSV